MYITIRQTGIGALWSTAQRQYGDGTKWTRIWNHSINTGLRRRRGRPENIRAGDRFWVPK